MIKFTRTTRFICEQKKFVKKNPERAEALIRTLDQFQHNPKNPGLHTEKLKNNELWTARIDRGNRLFFIWKDKNIVILVDVGKHDGYRKY